MLLPLIITSKHFSGKFHNQSSPLKCCFGSADFAGKKPRQKNYAKCSESQSESYSRHQKKRRKKETHHLLVLRSVLTPKGDPCLSQLEINSDTSYTKTVPPTPSELALIYCTICEISMWHKTLLWLENTDKEIIFVYFFLLSISNP